MLCVCLLFFSQYAAARAACAEVPLHRQPSLAMDAEAMFARYRRYLLGVRGGRQKEEVVKRRIRAVSILV